MSIAETSTNLLFQSFPPEIQANMQASVTEHVYVWVISGEQSATALVAFLKINGFTNILTTNKNGLYTITCQSEFSTSYTNVNPDTSYSCPTSLPAFNCPNFNSESIDTLCFVDNECDNCSSSQFCYQLNVIPPTTQGEYAIQSYCGNNALCGQQIPTSCFTANGDGTYTLNYNDTTCNPFN